MKLVIVWNNPLRTLPRVDEIEASDFTSATVAGLDLQQYAPDLETYGVQWANEFKDDIVMLIEEG